MTKLEIDKLVALLDDKYLAEHVERIVWALENPSISTVNFLKDFARLRGLKVQTTCALPRLGGISSVRKLILSKL